MNHYKIFSLAAFIIAILASASMAQDTSSLPYMNPRLSPEERAADLVHRMTLEEKASQLVNQARAVPRLKIPSYDWWSEALHGVISDGVTEFPEPIGLAATFDVPRIHEMATAIGIEGRIKHTQHERAGHSNIFEGLDFWAPNVNIFRDPRWGRGQETYGEDPFLSARLAVAFVTGMQDRTPQSTPVIHCTPPSRSLTLERLPETKSSSCTCSFPTCPVRRGAHSADFNGSIWSPGRARRSSFS